MRSILSIFLSNVFIGGMIYDWIEKKIIVENYQLIFNLT